MTRRRGEAARRTEILRLWLWWATFAVKRATGSGVVSAFKAAQTAITKIYP